MENSSAVNSTSSWISNVSGSENTTSAPSSQRAIGYYGDVRVLLWQIIPPILIVFGTTGNLLTVLIITRMKKLSTTAMYLLALAFSDTMILFCGPLRNWINYVWEVDIRILTDAGCKIQLYLTYASIHFSSWLLVAVTLERTISVIFPHKVKLACTRRNAGLVILALFIFTFGVNIVIPVIQGLEGYGDKECAPTTKDYMDFRNYIWQWIDFCMAFAVPFLFLVVGNSVMILFLYRSRMRRKKMSALLRQKESKTGKKDLSVYVLMVALCVIFLLTMTPVTVYQIYFPFRRDQIIKLYKTDPTTAWTDFQYFQLVFTIVNLAGYTNAAFNFVLYVFTGTKFRTELKQLFRCKSPLRKVFDLSGNKFKLSDELKTKSTGVTRSSSGNTESDESASTGQDPKLSQQETLKDPCNTQSA